MPRKGENIRKRKDGRWEGRYTVAHVELEKPVVRSVYGKTYLETKQKLTEARIRAMTIKRAEDGRSRETYAVYTVEEAAGEWLLRIQATRKYATYVKYKNCYARHLRSLVGEWDVKRLNREKLQEVLEQYFSSQTASSSIRHSLICVLNQIIAHGAAACHMPVFVLENHSAKAASRPVKVFSHREQSVIMNALYQNITPGKLGIILCLFTGLRLGEICSLRWNDIDFTSETLHVNRTVQRIEAEGHRARTALLESEPKSRSSRRGIPLSRNMVRLLKEWQAAHVPKHSGDYIIHAGGPMEPRTYQYFFQSFLKEIGVEYKNFHVLRHTFATNCVESGMDVKSLSELLGHSDVKITLNRYVHPSLEMKRSQLESLDSIYGHIMGQQSDRF